MAEQRETRYYLLFYKVVEQFAERRLPHRQEHLAMAQAAHDAGDLVLGGAYGEPPSGAALLFKVADVSTVEQFASTDPYVTNGLVRKWTVEPWHVVIGSGK